MPEEENKKKWDIGWSKLSKANKIVAIIILIIGVVVLFRSFGNGDPQPKSTVSQPTQEQVQAKEQARKDLEEFMQLAAETGLVQSYEFSEKANVVYVNKVWYAQTVQFKKDFLATIANTKKAWTGYRWFEVRDTFSDEKVAEVTAFSGSLKVYK